MYWLSVHYKLNILHIKLPFMSFLFFSASLLEKPFNSISNITDNHNLHSILNVKRRSCEKMARHSHHLSMFSPVSVPPQMIPLLQLNPRFTRVFSRYTSLLENGLHEEGNTRDCSTWRFLDTRPLTNGHIWSGLSVHRGKYRLLNILDPLSIGCSRFAIWQTLSRSLSGVISVI